MTIDFLAEAKELFPYTQKLRRDFHMHPELGFQEVRTAGIVADELTQVGNRNCDRDCQDRRGRDH